jgi:hypothetical protein
MQNAKDGDWSHVSVISFAHNHHLRTHGSVPSAESDPNAKAVSFLGGRRALSSNQD